MRYSCAEKNLEEEFENHAQLSTNSSRHTIMDEEKPTSHEVREICIRRDLEGTFWLNIPRSQRYMYTRDLEGTFWLNIPRCQRYVYTRSWKNIVTLKVIIIKFSRVFFYLNHFGNVIKNISSWHHSPKVIWTMKIGPCLICCGLLHI
jgi:hypothetical protein